ncbi:MAG: hypothetical protein L6R39_004578, partial [Caloplaca ligustica]
MSIRSRTFTRNSTAVLRGPCRLWGSCVDSQWVVGGFNRSRLRAASSPSAIGAAHSAPPGTKYGSDLSASASKRKRDDLLNK